MTFTDSRYSKPDVAVELDCVTSVKNLLIVTDFGEEIGNRTFRIGNDELVINKYLFFCEIFFTNT